MAKALAAVLLLLVFVLGAQAFHGTYTELQKTKTDLVSYQEARASEPPTLLPFDLPQADGESLKLSDVADSKVVLLYVYSDDQRDPDAEQGLADAKDENPDKVKVIALRVGGADGAAPAELTSIAITGDDLAGKVANSYGARPPAVVVLKNRPIFHAALEQGSASRQLEETVDFVLAGDDLVAPEGGCGGGCGTAGGGGCSMGPEVAAGCGAPGAEPSACPADEIISEKETAAL